MSPSPFVFIWCQPAACGDAARAGHAALLPALHGSAHPGTDTGMLALAWLVQPKPVDDAQPIPTCASQGASPVTLQHGTASLRPRQGWGDLRVSPVVCRTACTSLCHSACCSCVPVSPCQHWWDFGLGLSWRVGNIEPVWLWAHGIKLELGMAFGAR